MVLSNLNVSVSGLDDTDTTTKQSTIGRNRTGYASNSYGHNIVNAVSGIETEHTVGSKNEHLYYKVMSDGNVYFYDSPEQYLRHRFSKMKYRPRNIYDKMRKDDMLENRRNVLIHWALVDAQGQNITINENDSEKNINKIKNSAFMSPYINMEMTTRWISRRTECISSKVTSTANDNDDE